MAVNAVHSITSSVSSTLGSMSFMVTGVIMIVVIGGIIIFIGYIMSRMGVGFTGGGRRRRGDVKLIIADENTVRELWGYWTKVRNVVAAKDPKTNTIYITIITPGSQPYYDTDSGAPVYFAKSTTVFDSETKITETFNVKDIINDNVVSNIYLTRHPAVAVAATDVNENTGEVSVLTASAVNQLLDAIEYTELRSIKASKVIQLKPNFKLALAASPSVLIDYITSLTRAHIQAVSESIFPIMEQLAALKRVRRTGSANMLLYILIIVLGFLLVYYIVSRVVH